MGRGSLKSAETICYEIYREILREVRQFDASKLLVVASQKVVNILLDEESDSVAELEVFVNVQSPFRWKHFIRRNNMTLSYSDHY